MWAGGPAAQSRGVYLPPDLRRIAPTLCQPTTLNAQTSVITFCLLLSVLPFLGGRLAHLTIVGLRGPVCCATPPGTGWQTPVTGKALQTALRGLECL